MTGTFDPLKALGEEIAGLTHVRATMIVEVQRAEQVVAEGQVKLDALLLLQGFCDGELKRKREVMLRLRADMEAGR